MKKTALFLLFSILILTAFKKNEEPKLNGHWARQFEVGAKQLHTAEYFIYQDSIRYTLNGPIGKANYLIKRDTFLLETNQFIGHTEENQYYLLFLKNITKDSISIYMQKTNNVVDALQITIPNDTITQNHGWNTFHKK